MNREVCQLVDSTRGKAKLNVRGYLLVKDKSRDEKYYWCCEYKNAQNCNGRATTNLVGEEHLLIKFVEHNHAPIASRVDVVQTLNSMRNAASGSSDPPAQIIQNTIANMPQDSYSYMPNTDALRKQINYVRKKHLPSQPQSLQDIDIPINLRQTIRGEQFLARDIEYGEEKMLIFCTTSNLQHLQNANYWIVDGTFKTVPILFQQLYTVHALVGGNDNATIFPMVYALMTNKSEESYLRFFQELIELGETSGYSLSPPLILSDFEQAVISASQIKFPNTVNKCCFFHFSQNLWRRIQSAGLSVEYGTNEDLSIKLRYLSALAFLPSAEIPLAFDHVKTILPPSTNSIVKYFEDTYVYGRVQRQLQNGSVLRSTPLFPPALWSVYELVEAGYPRTKIISRHSTIGGRLL